MIRCSTKIWTRTRTEKEDGEDEDDMTKHFDEASHDDEARWMN
jgi:hypothetical protein